MARQVPRILVDRRTNREIAEAPSLGLGADSRVEVAPIVERADRLAAAGA